MKHHSADLKQLILSQYQPGIRNCSFGALAKRYCIGGGSRTINRWYDRWDGTPSSLEHQQGAGRPRILTRRQVTQLITTPIVRHNRRHKAIHYRELKNSIHAKTGKSPSLQTIRRYGKQDARVRHIRTK